MSFVKVDSSCPLCVDSFITHSHLLVHLLDVHKAGEPDKMLQMFMASYAHDSSAQCKSDRASLKKVTALKISEPKKKADSHVSEIKKSRDEEKGDAAVVDQLDDGSVKPPDTSDTSKAVAENPPTTKVRVAAANIIRTIKEIYRMPLLRGPVRQNRYGHKPKPNHQKEKAATKRQSCTEDPPSSKRRRVTPVLVCEIGS